MTLSTRSPCASPIPAAELAERWTELARHAGIAPDERLLVALSGGADSVLLLHLAAAGHPRERILAVHVDHGLRGAESRADARAARALASSLGVRFELRRLALDPAGPSLEERARHARYAALAASARASGHTTLLTGHHADDVLETLLLRWMRGSAPAGLYGPRPDGPPPGAVAGAVGEAGPPLRLVRPLLPLRREEVRELLRARGLGWREDRSNADPRHDRARVRHALLPALYRWGGEEGLEGLRAFAAAAERLEAELARSTAHLCWRPHDAAWPPPASAEPGGRLERSALMRLPRMLRRRVLWRLLTTGVGRSPGARLLAAIEADLSAGRCSRHALPGAWRLLLRADELLLLPPQEARLPLLGPEAVALPVPGSVRLADGSRLSAHLASRGDAPPSRDPLGVELDADRLPRLLGVRLPRPGDRFHPLGAPGSKRLTRFLADQRLPREERRRLPLVVDGDEIVWVPGFRPAHAWRVTDGTRRRLRLRLEPPAGDLVPPR